MDSSNFPSASLEEEIKANVFDKVLRGLKERGIDYKGILFAGLMVNEGKLDVIEFNVRFGDPETQVLLPLLRGNLSETMLAAATGQLASLNTKIQMDNNKEGCPCCKSLEILPFTRGGDAFGADDSKR